MTDHSIRFLRRELDAAINRPGMRVGMPQVTVPHDSLNRVLTMAELFGAALDLLREATAAREDADERMDYVTVQVDRATLAEIDAMLARFGRGR